MRAREFVHGVVGCGVRSGLSYILSSCHLDAGVLGRVSCSVVVLIEIGL